MLTVPREGESSMITLHRLGHANEPFQLNPDLIVTVESTPDTVVTLTTAAKVVVAESPDEVVAAVRAWRVGVLSDAMRNRRPEPEPARPRTREGGPPLSVVDDGAA
jgi:flagellar protein FlbD